LLFLEEKEKMRQTNSPEERKRMLDSQVVGRKNEEKQFNYITELSIPVDFFCVEEKTNYIVAEEYM
jgi:hypothetical protein